MAACRLFIIVLVGLSTSAFAQGERLNRTIELLDSGKPVIGHFVFDQSNGNAIKIATSKADFVIIDLEHQPYDVGLLRSFLQQMTNKQKILEKGSLQMDVTPIIRLPTSDTHEVGVLAKQVLNVGAFGLMFPTVQTREQALQAVQVSRFPQIRGAADMEPAGLRGYEPFQQAMWYWGINREDYYQHADVWPLDPEGEVLVVIQIESAEGVRNVEDIVSVPGIGAVLVGSFDLSVSLGIVGQMNHPDLGVAVQAVVKACIDRNIPVGSTSGPIEDRIEAGQTFLVGGPSDTAIDQARQAAGRD